MFLSATNIETFYGPVPALKGVSMGIEKGTITCVIGANGAGKTTLINTIAGILEPRFGQVSFNGMALTKLSPDAVAHAGIILSPEGRQVFPTLTVAENLKLGSYRSQARACAQAISKQVFSFFPRLKERENQRAGMLSGGEQQMLAIGRALMANPQVLLLDEPSMGLSPKFVDEIYQVLSEINENQKLTILVAEQNAAIALRTASFGYVMELGRIVLAGEADELLTKDVLKESFLGNRKIAADQKRFKTKKRWR